MAVAPSLRRKSCCNKAQETEFLPVPRARSTAEGPQTDTNMLRPGALDPRWKLCYQHTRAANTRFVGMGLWRVSMLYNDEERRTMALAVQPNMRSANISIGPFQNIAADFLQDRHFVDRDILDIGPGQLDFLDIARTRGARTTRAIDFDPAIRQLGNLRGHDVEVADLKQGWPLVGQRFSGIFCRGSINCFWYESSDVLLKFLDGIVNSIEADGWLWIAPWNKPAPTRPTQVPLINATIELWLTQRGISQDKPDEESRRRYGIGYTIPDVVIWRRL